MNHYLIICRSVTQAQMGSRVLAAVGITSRLYRAPMGLTERGCSYALQVGQPYIRQALAALSANQIRPVKVVLKTADGYREVTSG